MDCSDLHRSVRTACLTKQFQTALGNFSFKFILEKLIKIHDSPQRIALGFGLGIFLGIFPGVGPLASLVLATFFRINQAAALTGSLLTNTWLSVVTFVVSIQIGSFVTGADWQQVYEEGQKVIRDFHWQKLGEISFSTILLPLLAGYLIIGLSAGFLGYGIIYYIVSRRAKTIRKDLV